MCLKQQKLIFSQLWRRGVQGQGVGRIGFSWGLPPSCADPCPQVFSVLPGPLPCGYRWLLPSRSHVTFTSLKIHLKYVRTRVWAFKMNLDTVQTVIVITWWEFEVHPILSLYHVWFTSFWGTHYFLLGMQLKVRICKITVDGSQLWWLILVVLALRVRQETSLGKA